uniref:Nucleotid_trans domain-containing protein n=1 Tax=Caenorhabditis japonica TaxID=281687 RepID=A0A8R1DP90_CAEJA
MAKLPSYIKLFGYGFVLLVFRKIVIACMAMYIVFLNWEDVSFEKLIENPSLQMAMSKMKMHPSRPGLILILNKHALNMTYNWLCNTQNLKGVHENSYIVTLDDESSLELNKFWPNVAQINIVVPGLKDPFNYGDGYYQLFYLFRANLARAIIHYNREFWMVQQDTFWNESILKIDTSEDVDIFFDRASDTSPLIAGGYFHVKPTIASKKFFSKLAKDISWWYAPDNAYMTSLCEVSGIAKCGRLSFDLIINWQWLQGVSGLTPKFIQFDGETKLGGKLAKNTKYILETASSKWEKVASTSHKQFKMYQDIVDTFYATRIGTAVMNHFILPYAHYCMLTM